MCVSSPLAVVICNSQPSISASLTPYLTLPFPPLETRGRKLCLDKDGFVYLLRHINAYEMHAARATTGTNTPFLLGSLGSNGTDQRLAHACELR